MTPPRPPAKRRGIRKRWIALAAVVGLGGVGAYGVWKKEQDYQAGHAAYLAGDCAYAVGLLSNAAEGSSGSSGNDTELKARAEWRSAKR